MLIIDKKTEAKNRKVGMTINAILNCTAENAHKIKELLEQCNGTYHYEINDDINNFK